MRARLYTCGKERIAIAGGAALCSVQHAGIALLRSLESVCRLDCSFFTHCWGVLGRQASTHFCPSVYHPA